MNGLWLLIPIKRFTEAKQRLAPALGPAERQQFAMRSARHVLGVARACPGIEQVVVVSNDPAARELAREFGAMAVDEVASESGERALSRILEHAMDQAAARGARQALYLATDLPRLSCASLQRLIARHAATTAGATLARARRDGGSNALLLDLPRRFALDFGAGSAARHAALAAAAGVSLRVIDDPDLAQDVDLPEDLPGDPPPIESGPLGRSTQLETLTEARALDAALPLHELLNTAALCRDRGFPSTLSYSRKVFIPLTRLCRDVCHYCTFATTPGHLPAPYLRLEEVLEIARAGRDAGCHEALFTLGDRPETRYRVARDWLAEQGFDSTVAYLEAAAHAVIRETGLLPHINAGVLSESEYRRLRPVAASMGLMLETAASRLSERGGPHFGSPDKHPAVRLESIAAAGRARIPLTTGLLIGIGETRDERLESLFALRDLQREHGHLQELILQNFVPKPGTLMAEYPTAPASELQWTVAMARLIFGPHMSLQAPPNLNPSRLSGLIDSGINDWGGVSPVTIDHVNPESPWPAISGLARVTAAAGRALVPRLTVYPQFIATRTHWLDPGLAPAVLKLADASGLARTDDWCAGASQHPARPGAERGAEPVVRIVGRSTTRRGAHPIANLLNSAARGDELGQTAIERLFNARGTEVDRVVEAADELRRSTRGDAVTYVVNRNINYTNICLYHCSFCAFSKGRGAADLRGPAYRLDCDEVAARAIEAAARGATEVCMQGGIHPSFTGETYLALLRAVKTAVPQMHVHAFSPLEVQHGATTLGLSVSAYLEQLKRAGLGSLPGTAAEILDDAIRAQICPDKLNTAEWLGVIEAAHDVGLRTTATIMFGHLEAPASWAQHLLAIRELQRRTGGFTEFVPLPFVHMEAPMYRRGLARRGPTWREALLMHAVARLALHPHLTSIQASWVKLGPQGAARCLDAGVNDLGGVLMNESISRAAGAAHGQEFDAAAMHALISRAGREPQQRTTLYGAVSRAAATAAPAAEARLHAHSADSGSGQTAAPASAPDRQSA